MVTFVFLVSHRLLHHQDQLLLFYFGSKDQTLDLTCYAGVLPVSHAPKPCSTAGDTPASPATSAPLIIGSNR